MDNYRLRKIAGLLKEEQYQDPTKLSNEQLIALVDKNPHSRKVDLSTLKFRYEGFGDYAEPRSDDSYPTVNCHSYYGSNGQGGDSHVSARVGVVVNKDGSLTGSVIMYDDRPLTNYDE